MPRNYFTKHKSSANLLVVATNIVDDVLMASPREVLESIIAEIRKKLRIGNSCQRIWFLCVLWSTNFPRYGHSISIQRDEKLTAHLCYQLLRQRIKKGREALIAVETS